MIRRRTGLLTLTALLHVSSVNAAWSAANDAIEIRQRSGLYELTVPASRLVLIIPRGNLVPQERRMREAGSNRYFYLEDTVQPLIVSGWFEPATAFPGVREYWDNSTKQWRENGLPEPQIVTFARISGWEAVFYEIAMPSGSNSHLRAHWLEAGTWIDLHLSITSDRTVGENRAELKRALKLVRVLPQE